MIRLRAMKTLPAALLTAALLSTACKSEIDGKPAAKVEDVKTDAKADAKAPAKAEPPAAAARTLKIDKGSSSIGFVGSKVTGDHKGSFGEFEGEAVLEGDVPKSVRFTVQTTSVTTDAEGLTDHLKKADFFDVEKFPTATFSSTAITEKKTDAATHEIAGELDLHGVKKAITFPATVRVDGQGVKGTAEFTINRKDFQIVYPGKPDDLIKDEVLLKLDLNFKPAA